MPVAVDFGPWHATRRWTAGGQLNDVDGGTRNVHMPTCVFR